MVRLARDDVAIRSLAEDLRALLSAWFDIGLLELRQIGWDSPAALLEKLIAYESVHAIRSWDDLKNRLAGDRRCFSFFHPNMPDEPLIFVEVALVNGMAASVDSLLDEAAPELDPGSVDTAIFYSISNAQQGLAGISFGNFLIKRVVEVLGREFPGLKTFATLSPIPGFARWLQQCLDAGADDLLTPTARRQLRAYSDAGGDAATLGDLLGRKGHDAGHDPVQDVLREPLLRLAARYLTTARRDDGRIVDAVAHFHLSNGARVEQVNWLADRSERGIRQSRGMMVNYLYRPDEIEDNTVAYLQDRQIRHSARIRALLRD